MHALVTGTGSNVLLGGCNTHVMRTVDKAHFISFASCIFEKKFSLSYIPCYHTSSSAWLAVSLIMYHFQIL